MKRRLSDYHHERLLPNYNVDRPDEKINRIEKLLPFDEIVFTKEGKLNISYPPVRVSAIHIHNAIYLT